VDDPVCDYLDVFERYGFFPTDSTVHTVEVRVPSELLFGERASERASSTSALRTGGRTEEFPAGDALPAWRRDLIVEASMLGCDEEFSSWWVPDEAVDACPLFVAVRAALVSAAELAGASAMAASAVLRRPIKRELEARSRMAAILRAHLAGYASPATGLRGLRDSPLTVEEETAVRLVHFEQRLLMTHVRALQAPV
jgi:hypothetical protein